MDGETSKRLIMKQFLVAILTVLPGIGGCVANGANVQTERPSLDQQRPAVHGVDFIVDAVPRAEMFGVEMFENGSARAFYGKARQSERNKSKMSLPITQLPEKVRVIWRQSYKPKWAADGRLTFDGILLGDYTIAVASRIPQEVFDDLSKGKGQLRLKFRLKPDGVMFGWDVERRPGFDTNRVQKENIYYPPVYSSVGGDFLDTRY